MSFFYEIDKSKMGKRTARNLLLLREQLDKEIPKRTIGETILLATWNIREFDSTKYGFRTEESMNYIAEIVSRFDLVAVQEVRRDLSALKKLASKLGGWWKFLVTDVSGNSERMVFLYDMRKIRFGGLAAEIVLPDKKGTPVLQLQRTPYLCGFKAGWFRFMLTTVHILYGKAEANNPRRLREIEELAKFLKKRATENTAWSNNMILVGDFNIFSTSDDTFKAITKQGFIIPDKIQKLPANVPQNKHYDQMAFLTKRKMDLKNAKAGVFKIFEHIYRDEDEQVYVGEMGDAYHKTSKGKPRTNKSSHYKSWRTHQMSDHYPMWVELKIDYGGEYLKGVAK